MSKANTNLLTNQINTIKLEDGTNIKYLPPNKSYKMLGVQMNPMLDFRDHLKRITTEVRKTRPGANYATTIPQEKIVCHRSATQIQVPLYTSRNLHRHTTKYN